MSPHQLQFQQQQWYPSPGAIQLNRRYVQFIYLSKSTFCYLKSKLERFIFQWIFNNVNLCLLFYRRRLNSTGSEEEEEEFRSIETTVSSSSPNTSINGSFEEHFSLMDARECLPEFSGQVPMKKKSTRIESVTNDELQSKTKTRVSIILFLYTYITVFFQETIGCMVQNFNMA